MPVVTCLLLIGAGAALTYALCRFLALGRWPMAILFGSFTLRVVLAVAMYVISAWDLPLLQSLHLEDGFWSFSIDAFGYHWLGNEVAETFRWGTELPSFRYYGEADFFFLVGAIYRVLGTHPLYVPLLNAAVGSVLLAVVYVLGSRLTGERGGTAAMTLVALCPSAYIWSSQVMKDPIVWTISVTLILLVADTLEGRHQLRSLLWLWLAFAPFAFLLIRLRSYIVPLLAAAVIVTTLMRLYRVRRDGSIIPAMRGFAVTAALLALFLVARGIDTLVLLTPSNPTEGHLRKARYLDAHGDAAQAQWERLRASGEVPSWPSNAMPNEVRRYRLEHPAPWQYDDIFGKDRRHNVMVYEGEVAARLAPSGSSSANLQGKNDVVQVGEAVELLRQWLSIRYFRIARNAFSHTQGGGALSPGSVTTTERLNAPADLLRAVPSGLAYGLWAPFPWQAPGGRGQSGGFRTVAGLEVLLLIALTPWLARAVVRSASSWHSSAWVLVVYALGFATALGITVTNVGILFRLRLQFLIPLLVVVGAFGLAESPWPVLLTRQRRAH